MTHIVRSVGGKPGWLMTEMQLFDLFGEFKYHVVLQIHYLAVLGKELDALNVAVGKRKGVLLPHAAAYRRVSGVDYPVIVKQRRDKAVIY